MNISPPQDASFVRSAQGTPTGAAIEQQFSSALQNQNIPTHIRRLPDSPSSVGLRRENPLFGQKIYANRFVAREEAHEFVQQPFVMTAPTVLKEDTSIGSVPEGLAFDALTLQTEPASPHYHNPAYGNRTTFSSYHQNEELYTFLENVAGAGYDIRKQEYQGSDRQKIIISFILNDYNTWMQSYPESDPTTFFVVQRALAGQYPSSTVQAE